MSFDKAPEIDPKEAEMSPEQKLAYEKLSWREKDLLDKSNLRIVVGEKGEEQIWGQVGSDSFALYPNSESFINLVPIKGAQRDELYKEFINVAKFRSIQ